jgi:hypothetical protein
LNYMPHARQGNTETDRAGLTSPPVFHNRAYPTFSCKRNIEMTPLCKVDVTLPGVRGALGVRGAGGVDEQEGIWPA